MLLKNQKKLYWIHSLLQIVTYECTTARINGAKHLTIDAWQCFLSDIRDCIKEWLLCFYCPSLSPSLLTGLWDIKYVSVVLFCYILNVMLYYVWKIKNVDDKKKKKCMQGAPRSRVTNCMLPREKTCTLNGHICMKINTTQRLCTVNVYICLNIDARQDRNCKQF